MSGFIQLHRKLLEWEWWDDHNTTRVFLYCLLKANWKPNKWKGYDIDRGQFPTGLCALSKEIGLSKQQMRTCLKKLQNSKNINIKTTNKFSIVTVVNYDFYQTDNTQSTHKPTHEQHTNNTQITTLEEGNKDNKDNNILDPEKYFFIGLSFNITIKDKDKWLQSYKNLNEETLLVELQKADDYYRGSEKKGIFFKVSKWVSKANDDAYVPPFRGAFG